MGGGSCDILHVIATTPWPAAADALLAEAKAGRATVCVLDDGDRSTAAGAVRAAADGRVDCRGGRGRVAAWRLRQVVRERRPAEVRAWGLEAMAACGWRLGARGWRLAGGGSPSVPPAAGRQPPAASPAWVGRVFDLDPAALRRRWRLRRLLRRFGRIDCGDAAVAAALAEACGAGGRGDGPEFHVLPAAACGSLELPDRAGARARLGIGADVPVILSVGPWPRTLVTEPTVWATAFVARVWAGMRLLMVDPYGQAGGGNTLALPSPFEGEGSTVAPPSASQGKGPADAAGLPEYVRVSAASCAIAGAPLAVAADGVGVPADALAAADVLLLPWPRIGPSPAARAAMAAGLAILARDCRSSREQLAGYGHAELFGRPLPIEAAKALHRRLAKQYG